MITLIANGGLSPATLGLTKCFTVEFVETIYVVMDSGWLQLEAQ
jgi:hypothetical protein